MLFEYANSSIKAILYGIAFIFFVSNIKLFQKYLVTRIIYYLSLLTLIYMIVLLNSRIVWIGIVLVQYIRFIAFNKALRFRSKLLITLPFVLSLAILFFYKLPSSLGRFFIYKINLNMLKDYWLNGINQPYNVLFNHYQSDYFSKNPNAILNEKLLASNGFFVFNEWLNIFLHFGVFWFCASIFLFIIILCIAFKNLYNGDKIGASSTIIFLLIVSMVSYPFSFYIFQFIFSICVIVLLTKGLINKVWQFVFPLTYFALFVLLISKEYTLYKSEKVYKEIFNLYQTGSFNKSLELYYKSKDKSPFTGPINLQIAKVYFQKNNTDSALICLEKAHKHYCTDELHLFWGDCLLQENRTQEAIAQYNTAINIVPAKFGNKMKLLKAYGLIHDTANAILIAKSMINFPEKIPSAKSKFYKQKAKNYLEKYKMDMLKFP